MYSLIVMTAMAGGGDTSSFHGRLVGNLFCGGCHSSVVSSCHGCTGASCTGCSGTPWHGCSGGVYGSRFAARPMSCFGASCHGCTGCHGSVEIWGASCHGSSCTGCMGSSCHGCFGSSTRISYYEGEVISMPSIGTVKLESEDAASANIRIELPAGAKLYVEGHLVDTSSGQFHTPPLRKGKAYYYDMKAEMTVNGKTLTDEKRVVVRGGETTVEKFGPTPLAAK
jgi:uncharacterized protein (TIGR03000 family)